MSKPKPLYVCVGCSCFATVEELTAHRGEHHALGIPDAGFWAFYFAKWPNTPKPYK